MDNNTKDIKKMSKENTKKQLVIEPKHFDIKRFTLNPIIDDKPRPNQKGEVKSFQYTLFPKYDYPNKSTGENNTKVDERGQHLRFITKPIQIKRGGLQKYNEKWHKSKGDAAFFWLCLDKEFAGEGCTDVRSMFEKIDKTIGEQISKKPDAFATRDTGLGEREPITKLKYASLVKESAEPETPSADWKPWYRCKVCLPIKGTREDGDPILNVTLAVLDEESGKIKQLVATSMAELIKYFAFGCEAQFIIDMKSFGILKKPGTDKCRTCKFKLTCDMINITKRSSAPTSKESHDWNDFIGAGGSDNDDDNKESKSTKRNEDEDSDSKKNSKKESVKSKSDSEAGSSSSSSDSGSDEDSPPPPPKKTEKSKKNDTDDEDSRSKKSEKSKKNKNDDSDADEEPKKKSEKSKKKDESDGEDEQKTKNEKTTKKGRGK